MMKANKDLAEAVLKRLLVVEKELDDLRLFIKGFVEIDASPDVRARMCTGKRRYRTLEAAGNAAEMASAKSGDKLRIYACPCCDKYHLTKKSLEAVAGVTP